MDISEVASLIAVLLAAYATYRNSTRKAELDRLNARVVDLEKRLADSDQRANDNEHRAIEYREAVIKLGEELNNERHETMRRMAMIAQDGNQKINKVVIVLEKVIKDLEAAGGKSDVDMDALRRLAVDNITGPLGPIDIDALNRYAGARQDV